MGCDARLYRFAMLRATYYRGLDIPRVMRAFIPHTGWFFVASGYYPTRVARDNIRAIILRPRRALE